VSTKPDTVAARMIDRNINLAFDHLRAILDNPDLLAEIPNGATVVDIPDDDVELAQYNLALALFAFARGKNVYLRHVGTALDAAASSPP
jgi:Family of unknown function (DUF5647)